MQQLLITRFSQYTKLLAYPQSNMADVLLWPVTWCSTSRIARSIAFLDFRVLRWKFTYDWKCVNTTYRVPLFCPLPASRKGLRLTLRSALFGEGGRDWRPCNSVITIYLIYVVLVTCITMQMTTGQLDSINIHVLWCLLKVPIYDRLPYTMVLFVDLKGLKESPF